MLHDRQTQVVKRKRLLLPRIRLARTEAAQAIRLVKGRFFDRIRAFADSLNPPALKADDNASRAENLGEESMRAALEMARVWTGSGRLRRFWQENRSLRHGGWCVRRWWE